jgi:hypothetical protein
MKPTKKSMDANYGLSPSDFKLLMSKPGKISPNGMMKRFADRRCGGF